MTLRTGVHILFVDSAFQATALLRDGSAIPLGDATLSPNQLRDVIQRRRQSMSAFASLLEWLIANADKDGEFVPRKGATFWHQMGANKSDAQVLPDTFATGLATQVTEGSPYFIYYVSVAQLT